MTWADAPNELLHATRERLLNGLDRVAAHIDAGTLDQIPPGRASTPRDGGHLTLILLNGIDAELANREGDTTP